MSHACADEHVLAQCLAVAPCYDIGDRLNQRLSPAFHVAKSVKC